jgi:hypothetical protein
MTRRRGRRALVLAVARSRLRWPVTGLLVLLIAGMLAAGHVVEHAAL